jgi:mannose-6-phosphate isomerase-like protein (cupin superfamily)
MTDTHIEMQVVDDENGSLLIYENFPFEVKRTFVIYMRVGRQRGGHANHECEQVFSVISGDVVLRVETAEGKEEFHMRQSGRGIYVPAMAWRTLMAKTRFACVLVHASMMYDESDYIRTHEEFKNALQQH